MTNKTERRVMVGVELRVTKTDDGKARIVGHAAKFNAMSEDLGGFRETIARGAFRESTGKDDIRALFNHDPNQILGRNTAGTLNVREDREGLLVEIDPPNTTWANDLLVSIERGDVSGMSFGFRTLEDEWNVKDEEQIRTLRKVELFDVSPVTFPAYPDTDVAVRSMTAWLKTQDPADIFADGRRKAALLEANPS